MTRIVAGMFAVVALAACAGYPQPDPRPPAPRAECPATDPVSGLPVVCCEVGPGITVKTDVESAKLIGC